MLAMTSWTSPSTTLQHSIWISIDPVSMFMTPSHCYAP